MAIFNHKRYKEEAAKCNAVVDHTTTYILKKDVNNPEGNQYRLVDADMAKIGRGLINRQCPIRRAKLLAMAMSSLYIGPKILLRHTHDHLSSGILKIADGLFVMTYLVPVYENGRNGQRAYHSSWEITDELDQLIGELNFCKEVGMSLSTIVAKESIDKIFKS